MIKGLAILVALGFGVAEAAGCREGSKQPVYGQCSAYKECVQGQLKVTSCWPWMRFDPVTKSCLAYWKVDCDRVCKEADQRFDPDNCQNYQECIDGVWSVKSCSTGQRYDYKTKQCRIVFLADCGKPLCKENTTRAIEFDCQNYEVCIADGFVKKACPTGTRFDPAKGECLAFWKVDCPTRCEENSTRAAHGNCSQYQECRQGVFVTLTCPEGQKFDALRSHACKDAVEVNCEECKIEGAMTPVRDDCQAYQHCENGFMVKRTCWTGMRFDIEKKECRFKWSATCAPKEPVCKIGERRPVKNSCTDYYDCQEGQWVRQTCLLNKYFDKTTTVCQDPTKVHCQGCVEGEKRAVMGDPQSYMECVDGVSVKKSCVGGTEFDAVTETCVPVRGSCHEGDLAAVLSTCDQYLKCDTMTGNMVRVDCPLGSWYQWQTAKCVTYSQAGECKPKVCEDDQVPPTAVTADRCRSYVACSRGQYVVLYCDNEYLFDDSRGKCMPDKDVRCADES